MNKQKRKTLTEISKTYTQHCVYSKLPICSFTLKAKIPAKYRKIVTPKTLGEHIKKVRLKRKHQQQYVAKKLNVTSVMLSNWENNHQIPKPKHIDSIINYLGYKPKIRG